MSSLKHLICFDTGKQKPKELRGEKFNRSFSFFFTHGMQILWTKCTRRELFREQKPPTEQPCDALCLLNTSKYQGQGERRGVSLWLCTALSVMRHRSSTGPHAKTCSQVIVRLTEKILTEPLSSSSQMNLALRLVRRSSSIRGGFTNTA